MKNVRQFLIYFAILILVINYLLYHTISLYNLKDIMRIIAMLLLICSILLNKKLKISPHLLIIVFYMILGLILKSELIYNLLFLLLILFSISMNCEYSKIDKHLFFISFASVFAYIILYKFGYIENYVTAYGGRIRNSLGFDNVNSLSLLIASPIFLLLSREDNKLITNIICLTIVIAVTKYTDSRTLLFSTILFVALNFLFRVNVIKKIEKILNTKKWPSLLLTLLFFGSPIIMLIVYKFYPVMDTILSYRITKMLTFIKAQNILNYIVGFTKLNEIDNSFLLLFFTVGLIGYLFLAKIFYKYLSNKDNLKYLPFTISVLFYGLMEGVLLRPESMLTIYFWIIVFHSSNILYFKEKEFR